MSPENKALWDIPFNAGVTQGWLDALEFVTKRASAMTETLNSSDGLLLREAKGRSDALEELAKKVRSVLEAERKGRV
jgi:hypothetical protein